MILFSSLSASAQVAFDGNGVERFDAQSGQYALPKDAKGVQVRKTYLDSYVTGVETEWGTGTEGPSTKYNYGPALAIEVTWSSHSKQGVDQPAEEGITPLYNGQPTAVFRIPLTQDEATHLKADPSYASSLFSLEVTAQPVRVENAAYEKAIESHYICSSSIETNDCHLDPSFDPKSIEPATEVLPVLHVSAK
jgi:hypothetical protein